MNFPGVWVRSSVAAPGHCSCCRTYSYTKRPRREFLKKAALKTILVLSPGITRTILELFKKRNKNIRHDLSVLISQ